MYEKPELAEIALQILKGDLCRGFSIQSQCWYGESIKRTEHPDFVDQMSIGIYANGYDEGTHGEFQVTWSMLDSKMVARLKAFDDSWGVFPLFTDMFAEMALMDSNWYRGGHSISSTDFGAKLVQLGYVDCTKRTQKSLPHAPDYKRMKLRSMKPQRVEPPFVGILKDRPPIVVGFMGGAGFDEGCITDEVRDFVEKNCSKHYVIDPNDIFFEDEGDALLVSMRFGK